MSIKAASMMTMMMMQRIIESTQQKPPETTTGGAVKPESPQLQFLPDDEKCNNSESDEEELNVDVETDDALCPVDLTRRQQDERQNCANTKTESVCSSDDVNSRSVSPMREQSPSVVVPHQNNRRLAFSVENILDPNKFTGRQHQYNDGVCCWKPHPESLGSPEYDGSETGNSYSVHLQKTSKFNNKKDVK